LSFSKNVANPFEAIFGSLTTSPFASTARGRSPNCPASRRPAVSSIRKLCSRKKPHATSAYVDLKSGQRNAAKPAITKIVPIGSHADGEMGEKSARIIPSIAARARPRNGWRAVIGKFTSQPLGHLSSGFASQKVSDDLLRDLPDEVFGYFWIDFLQPRALCLGAKSEQFPFACHMRTP